MAQSPTLAEENHGIADTDDGPEPGEECGRWMNGALGKWCSKAGTEECDFECPHRGAR